MTAWFYPRQPSRPRVGMLLTASLTFHALALLVVTLLAAKESRLPRVILTSGQTSQVMRINLVAPKRTLPAAKPTPPRTVGSITPAMPEIPIPLPTEAIMPRTSDIDLSEPEQARPLPVIHANANANTHEQSAWFRLPPRPSRPLTQAPPLPAARSPVLVQPATDRTRGVSRGVKSAHVPMPRYPATSRTRGEEGVVVVKVKVNATGSASSVRLQRPCPFPRLNRAALMAAQKARFLPAIKNGVLVQSATLLTFRFVLLAR